MMFKDRTTAGRQLAAQLSAYKSVAGIVLAIPRGGVPVAYNVALELDLPLDIVLVKKIGHPRNKEYAIGAASLTDYVVTPHPEVTEAYIQQELISIRRRLATMRQKFIVHREPLKITGKTVIVIDDGAATGRTLVSTIEVIKQEKPARVIAAVPVMSNEAVQAVRKVADDVIVCLIPDNFYGVGAYYENFSEVSDEEVAYDLEKLEYLRKPG